MDTRNKHGFESHNEDALRNANVSYEPRDLGARGILTFLVVLFVAGVAIHLIVWGLFKVFTWQSQRNDPRLNPLVDQKAPSVGSVLQNTPRVNVQQFPEPRLQPDDVGDMDKMRIQEETILNSKSWKDQSGAVHIPIDEAMKILAAQGLPARSATAGQTESGSVSLQQQSKQGAATPAQQQQQH
jgi:hypothetical protein